MPVTEGGLIEGITFHNGTTRTSRADKFYASNTECWTNDKTPGLEDAEYTFRNTSGKGIIRIDIHVNVTAVPTVCCKNFSVDASDSEDSGFLPVDTFDIAEGVIVQSFDTNVGTKEFIRITCNALADGTGDHDVSGWSLCGVEFYS
jgi:hypothetical protein